MIFLIDECERSVARRFAPKLHLDWIHQKWSCWKATHLSWANSITEFWDKTYDDGYWEIDHRFLSSNVFLFFPSSPAWIAVQTGRCHFFLRVLFAYLLTLFASQLAKISALRQFMPASSIFACRCESKTIVCHWQTVPKCSYKQALAEMLLNPCSVNK